MHVLAVATLGVSAIAAATCGPNLDSPILISTARAVIASGGKPTSAAIAAASGVSQRIQRVDGGQLETVSTGQATSRVIATQANSACIRLVSNEPRGSGSILFSIADGEGSRISSVM
jgi:hypothetical protein